MKIKKNDIILVGCVVVLSLIALLVFKLTETQGSKVVVTIDGKVYNTFDLDKDMTFTVEEGGIQNTFEIKGGYVDMLDASCPDKICVEHKNIHYNHETIVCLPNKVVLEIVDGEESDLDMITN